MKTTLRAIQFVMTVFAMLVVLEFVHCAISEDHRRDNVVTWQLRHPVGAVKMRLGGDIAQETLYRSFREDPIYTGRALIAAMMM